MFHFSSLGLLNISWDWTDQGSAPTIQLAKKRNRFATEVRSAGNSEASSMSASTADGTIVPYESRPTQQEEQQPYWNYSNNIIPTTTYSLDLRTLNCVVDSNI